MKLTSTDVTNIITVLMCIGSIIVWGVRMEIKISDNYSYASRNEKIQNIKWDAMEKRLSEIRKDITTLESQVRQQ